MNIDELIEDLNNYIDKLDSVEFFETETRREYQEDMLPDTVLHRFYSGEDNYINYYNEKIVEKDFKNRAEFIDIINNLLIVTEHKYNTYHKNQEVKRQIVKYYNFQNGKMIVNYFKFEIYIKIIDCLTKIIKLWFICFEKDIENSGKKKQRKEQRKEKQLQYFLKKYLNPIGCNKKGQFLRSINPTHYIKSKYISNQYHARWIYDSHDRIYHMYRFSILLWSIDGSIVEILSKKNIVRPIEIDEGLLNTYLDIDYDKVGYLKKIADEMSDSNLDNLYFLDKSDEDLSDKIFDEYNSKIKAYQHQLKELNEIIQKHEPDPETQYDLAKILKRFEYINPNPKHNDDCNPQFKDMTITYDGIDWYKQLFLKLIYEINNIKVVDYLHDELPMLERFRNVISNFKKIISNCKSTVKSLPVLPSPKAHEEVKSVPNEELSSSAKVSPSVEKPPGDPDYVDLGYNQDPVYITAEAAQNNTYTDIAGVPRKSVDYTVPIGNIDYFSNESNSGDYANEYANEKPPVGGKKKKTRRLIKRKTMKKRRKTKKYLRKI